MRAGQVVIIGRPNAGKSTLINSIVNQKVSITSPKPQTTRRIIRAAYWDERGQIVFWDTPGALKKTIDQASKKINLIPGKTLSWADVVVYLIDKTRSRGDEENIALGLARKVDKPKILVINKIDIKKPDYTYEYEFLKEEFDDFIQISALKQTHLKSLLEKIFSFLPKTDTPLFDPKILQGKKVLNQTAEEFIEEIIREKVFLTMRQELPYSTAVVLKKMEEKKGMFVIVADILTYNKKYKAMIIGKNGQVIKNIGIKARKELELITNKKVFLDLQVIYNPALTRQKI